jgi:hypothetical protein
MVLFGVVGVPFSQIEKKSQKNGSRKDFSLYIPRLERTI